MHPSGRGLGPVYLEVDRPQIQDPSRAGGWHFETPQEGRMSREDKQEPVGSAHLFKPVSSRGELPQHGAEYPEALARQRRLSQDRVRAAGHAPIRDERRPSHGQRQPGHTPRTVQGVQRLHPQVQDHEGLSRSQEGRMGHPRPARGAGGGRRSLACPPSRTSRGLASRSSTGVAGRACSATSRSGKT